MSCPEEVYSKLRALLACVLIALVGLILRHMGLTLLAATLGVVALVLCFAVVVTTVLKL